MTNDNPEVTGRALGVTVLAFFALSGARRPAPALSR